VFGRIRANGLEWGGFSLYIKLTNDPQHSPISASFSGELTVSIQSHNSIDPPKIKNPENSGLCFPNGTAQKFSETPICYFGINTVSIT
jgi:hypothetical protein